MVTLPSFPLGFSDLSLWLAITAVLLLVASEIFSPYHGKTGLYINRKRLRRAGLIVSILFLATLTIRIFNIIIYP